MKIDDIIKLLKKQGCNSKQQVINKLENLTKDDLLELRRDINERIALEE
jgi:hypothetical protein